MESALLQQAAFLHRLGRIKAKCASTRHLFLLVSTTFAAIVLIASKLSCAAARALAIYWEKMGVTHATKMLRNRPNAELDIMNMITWRGQCLTSKSVSSLSVGDMEEFPVQSCDLFVPPLEEVAQGNGTVIFVTMK